MHDLVFILGAGRSGTNLLTFAFDRESPDFANLGENRYVWTYKQAERRSDQRRADEMTPQTRDYLHRYFAMRAERLGPQARVLLDKTPSNAFRIPFISAVFPEAKFIHIVRDGRDNLLSRSRQWKAQEPEEAASANPMSTVSGKLRYFNSRLAALRLLLHERSLPPERIPALLREVLCRNILPLMTGRKALYGERVPGLEQILTIEGTDAAAAVQWRESVLHGRKYGKVLGTDRYLELRYESFLESPIHEWHRVVRFLGRTPTGGGDRYLSKNLVVDNHRKWLNSEERSRINKLETHMRPTLEHLGYSWNLEDKE